jgi:hypothetical protein
MEVAKPWLDYLLQWVAYATYCIEQPISAPVCRPFWTLAMFAFIGIGGLVVIVIAWRIVSHRRRLAAALRAERDRAKIDYDAIAARRWDAEKAYNTDLGTDEVERRIREVVEQRQAANKPPGSIIVDK